MDQFAKWRALIAGQKLGEGVQVAENEVISGYFRTRHGKDQPWKALGIWRDGDFLVVILDGEDRTGDPKALDNLWPFCLHTPISYEVYQAVVERGERWPDLDPVVAAMLEARENRQGIGGNMPPDEADTLRAEVDALLPGLAAYKKIESDEALAKAQSLRAALLEKKGTAEKKHKIEKEPHLEEGRKVDRRWFSIRDLAQDAANSLRRAMQDWEDVKRARAAAAAAAERAAAAKKAPDPAAVPAPPLVPSAVADGPQQIRGGYGKAASSGTRMTVTAVTDVDEAIAHINATNPAAFNEIRELVAKIAQRLVDAGAKEVPGCVIEEKSVIR